MPRLGAHLSVAGGLPRAVDRAEASGCEALQIIDGAGGSPRVGVGLDTCHLLAAGYDLCSEDGYRDTFDQLRRVIGFPRLKAFHLNDSKKPCGRRVDRHEHIGKGFLGIEPFRRLVNDPRFATLPMLIETPKLDTPESRRLSDVDPYDQTNLDLLCSLIRIPNPSSLIHTNP